VRQEKALPHHPRPKKKAKVETLATIHEDKEWDLSVYDDEDALEKLVEDTVKELKKRPNPTHFSARKSVLVGLDDDDNTTKTCGVNLFVDGFQYSLPMAWLQSMNEYPLESGHTVFAPYPFWNMACNMAEDQEVDPLVRKTITKTLGLDQDPTPLHPCINEEELFITPCSTKNKNN
jgi:hypothetical protein